MIHDGLHQLVYDDAMGHPIISQIKNINIYINLVERFANHFPFVEVKNKQRENIPKIMRIRTFQSTITTPDLDRRRGCVEDILIYTIHK